MEAGPEKLPQRALVQAVDPGYWQWKPVIACAWGASHEHISALETRAYLLTLKWRLRSPVGLSERFLHLVDSQTAFGALVKHRSGSPLLHTWCAVEQRWSWLAISARPWLFATLTETQRTIRAASWASVSLTNPLRAAHAGRRPSMG